MGQKDRASSQRELFLSHRNLIEFALLGFRLVVWSRRFRDAEGFCPSLSDTQFLPIPDLDEKIWEVEFMLE